MHSGYQEVFELIKLDLSAMIIIKLVEKLIDIGHAWLLLDALLLEMVGKKVDNFVSIQNAIAILVVGLESAAHNLDLVL